MHFIVLDLEWNQAYTPEQIFCFNGTAITGEIIQIGAVRLNENMRIDATFNQIVKPLHYRRMHWRIEELTGITSDTLKTGRELSSVFVDFLTFCGKNSAILTWGTDDYPTILSNLRMNGISTDTLPPFYDLQKIYGHTVTENQKQTALADALEHFSMETVEPAHDALNDALSTAKLCPMLNIPENITKFDVRACDALTSILPWSMRKYSTYLGFHNSLANKVEIRCPDCGEILSFGEWLHFDKGKRSAYAYCGQQHYFHLRLKNHRNAENDIVIATRSLSRSNKHQYDVYRSRLHLQKIKKEQETAHK